MMKKIENTHKYLHDVGLQMLNRDFENIWQYLSNDTLLTDNVLDVMRIKLNEINSFKGVFVDNAIMPDKRERGSYFEKYEFIENYGMKVTIKKSFIPFLFSQHFYSTQELGNYIRIFYAFMDKHGIINKADLKKQGLICNAYNLFLLHGRCAVETCIKNNYLINDDVVKELSYAAHYLEDMNESHHASNKPAIFTNHSKFEKYAKENKECYVVDSISDIPNIPELEETEVRYWSDYKYDRYLNYEYLQNRDSLDSFCTVCRWIGLISNLFASGVVDYSTDARGDRVKWALSSNKKGWDKNLAQTIPMAQLSVSLFLFTFIAYISTPDTFCFKV